AFVLIFRGVDVEEERHHLGAASAEFNGLAGFHLGHAPQFGVIEGAVLDFVDDVRPAPAGIDFVEQRAGRVVEPGGGGFFGLEMVAFETGPALEGIVMPGAAGHVFIDVEIAVGEDVEAGALLVADDGGVGVLKLFAIADVLHAGVERTAPHADVEPARAGEGACGGAGKDQIFRGGEHGFSKPAFYANPFCGRLRSVWRRLFSMSENADFIHSLYAAFSRGDIATILASLTPDVDWVCEGPASVPFCGKFRGPVEVSKFFEALATTQTGHDLRIDETYEAGDQVITINRYACVVNVSGKKVDARGVHLFTVKNGKVARFRDMSDEIVEYGKPVFDLHKFSSTPIKIASIELLKSGNVYLLRTRSTDGAEGIIQCKDIADYIPILAHRVMPHF